MVGSRACSSGGHASGMDVVMSCWVGRTAFQMSKSGLVSRQSDAERMAWTVAPLSLRRMSLGVFPRERSSVEGTVRMT